MDFFVLQVRMIRIAVGMTINNINENDDYIDVTLENATLKSEVAYLRIKQSRRPEISPLCQRACIHCHGDYCHKESKCLYIT